MGQTMSIPETRKKSQLGGNDRLLYAVSAMQGWRIGMEDAHTTVLDLDGVPNSNAFFAVYDGHGGGRVSKFAGENLYKRLTSEEAYREQRYDVAFKRAFLGTDQDLLAALGRDPSGATAVAALVTPGNQIYVANAGDSRSVISVKGKAKPLSHDHKPTNESEKARICAAGGYIDFGRVNGNLALSRALGDFEFKKNSSLSPEQQIITSDPDVTCHEVTDDDEFLILACDGIWDCLSSQQVVDFVRYEVSQGKELVEITEMICDHCLAPDTNSRIGIGCDNMTILVVALLHGRTKEGWYSWITNRVRCNFGYPTPDTHPELYPPNRIMSLRARLELSEAREKANIEGGEPAPINGGRATVTTYIINPRNEALMFTGDDSDDDLVDDSAANAEMESFKDTHRSQEPQFQDLTSNLKVQFDLFEKDMREEDNGDGSLHVSESEPDEHSLQGEAPPSPRPLINGDLRPPVTPVEQLESQPGGDAPASVAKIEGLLDCTEDPLKI